MKTNKHACNGISCKLVDVTKLKKVRKQVENKRRHRWYDISSTELAAYLSGKPINNKIWIIKHKHQINETKGNREKVGIPEQR